MILLGLRGVGKTVLLNKIYTLAEDKGWTAKIEASRVASWRSASTLQVVLIRFANEKTRTSCASPMLMQRPRCSRSAMRGSTSAAALATGHDLGVLERDFSELMRAITEAAGQAGRPIAFFVDEIQYLSAQELGALAGHLPGGRAAATALHPVRRGPAADRGAGGGCQIPCQSGCANFPQVGPLPEDAARRAISAPAQAEGVEVTADAQAQIMTRTQNYPYFIQEWGRSCGTTPPPARSPATMWVVPKMP